MLLKRTASTSVQATRVDSNLYHERAVAIFLVMSEPNRRTVVQTNKYLFSKLVDRSPTVREFVKYHKPAAVVNKISKWCEQHTTSIKEWWWLFFIPQTLFYPPTHTHTHNPVPLETVDTFKTLLCLCKKKRKKLEVQVYILLVLY